MGGVLREDEVQFFVFDVVHVEQLHEDVEPLVAGQWRQIPFERLEHHQLHLEDLVFRARSVSHVRELRQLRRVDFLQIRAQKHQRVRIGTCCSSTRVAVRWKFGTCLQLGADEEGSDSNELQLLFLDIAQHGQVAVDEVHGEVVGLSVEPVHFTHLQQPQRASVHASFTCENTKREALLCPPPKQKYFSVQFLTS